MGDRSFFGGGGGAGGPSAWVGAAVRFGTGGTVTVPSGELVKLQFDTVDEDTDGFWDVAAKGFVIPAGQAGMYLVLGQIWWDAFSSVVNAYMDLEMDDPTGSTSGAYWPDNQVAPPSGYGGRQECLMMKRLGEEQGISLYAKQDNQPSEDQTVLKANSWFTITKLAL
jgi:hypothetical protein